jgi:hypothetical protein
MLSGILTATMLWVASAAGTVPAASWTPPAPAVENIYYCQIDGMT